MECFLHRAIPFACRQYLSALSSIDTRVSLIAWSTDFLHAAISFHSTFIKEKEDVAAWNFSASAIQAFSLALCTGVIMTGGIILLLISLDKLFNIEISTNYFIYVSILCNVILSPMLFLGLLPEKEKSMTTGFTTRILLTTSYAGCFYPY